MRTVSLDIVIIYTNILLILSEKNILNLERGIELRSNYKKNIYPQLKKKKKIFTIDLKIGFLFLKTGMNRGNGFSSKWILILLHGTTVFNLH